MTPNLGNKLKESSDNLCEIMRELQGQKQEEGECAIADQKQGSGEENSFFRKQLKVELRLSDINKLEEGDVDSGSRCILLLVSYCSKYGI